jgi:hypothetical protein
LVNEIISWAKAQHALSLFLIMTSNNDPAIRFYKRLGFTPTDTPIPTQTIKLLLTSKWPAPFPDYELPRIPLAPRP